MKTPEEIIRALKHCATGTSCTGCPYHPGENCTVRTDALNLILSMLEQGKIVPESPKPLKYWDLITAINDRQEAKGRAKYGEDLEDNTTLTTVQRIEHAEEEAIDLLKYLEHLKQVANDGMTADDFQRAAMRTAWTEVKEAMPPKVLAMLESGAFNQNEVLLLHGALGLGGESGEVEDLVKKWIFHGHDLVVEDVAEELCDVAWYLAIASYALGYKLSAIFQMNIDKRRERYPDGFDKNRSINREGEAK